MFAVVPVIYTSREDPEEKLRALKRSMQQDGPNKGFAAASSSSGSEQYPEPGASGSGIGNSEVSLTETDKKWRLEPAAVLEWEVSLQSGCISGMHVPHAICVVSTVAYAMIGDNQTTIMYDEMTTPGSL